MSSASQTTGSNEEDLYDYRDPREPEADRLEDDDRNWAIELQAHRTHITRYEKAAHNVWQRQYETYSSLLELAERRWASTSAIAGRTNQYVEAGHIRNKLLDRLDRHRRSRPGGTGSSDPVGAECMRSAENEGPGASPANRAPIPERTTHQFTTREGIDAYRAQALSGTMSAQ